MRDLTGKNALLVAVLAVVSLVVALAAQASTQPLRAQPPTSPTLDAAVPSLLLEPAKANTIHRITTDFLGRRATNDELERFVPRLGVGQDENDVRARVLASAAFFDHSGGTNSDFVISAYQQVLGRAPTQNELAIAVDDFATSSPIARLARRALTEELLARADYDPDGLGVREVVLHTDTHGDIVRFALELDEPFERSDRTAMSVSIGGEELEGVVRIRAFEDTISFVPNQPVKRTGRIVALAFVQQDGVTRLADLSTLSNDLPERANNDDPWPAAVFTEQRVVANYGHHTTAALGVLGETGPVAAVQRVQQVAAPFHEPGRPAVGAFEMIVTVAQASPGADGNFSSPSPIAQVEKWVDVAEAAGVYVVLDIQPGRSDFLTEARRYSSLLLRPNVGLALDPEWRMGPNQVPGQVVGKVSASEVNEVSLWLSNLTLENDLPEKIFIVHQFQERMITNREQLIDRPGLATVIHVDGFGSRIQKQATYGRLHVGPPLYNGFKLFIDEDRGLYQPHEVLAFSENPVPDFISYQ